MDSNNMQSGPVYEWSVAAVQTNFIYDVLQFEQQPMNDYL